MKPEDKTPYTIAFRDFVEDNRQIHEADSITAFFKELAGSAHAQTNVVVNYAARMFRRGENPLNVLKWLVENLIARADRIHDAEDSMAHAMRSFGIPKHIIEAQGPGCTYSSMSAELAAVLSPRQLHRTEVKMPDLPPATTTMMQQSRELMEQTVKKVSDVVGDRPFRMLGTHVEDDGRLMLDIEFHPAEHTDAFLSPEQSKPIVVEAKPKQKFLTNFDDLHKPRVAAGGAGDEIIDLCLGAAGGGSGRAYTALAEAANPKPGQLGSLQHTAKHLGEIVASWSDVDEPFVVGGDR